MVVSDRSFGYHNRAAELRAVITITITARQIASSAIGETSKTPRRLPLEESAACNIDHYRSDLVDREREATDSGVCIGVRELVRVVAH